MAVIVHVMKESTVDARIALIRSYVVTGTKKLRKRGRPNDARRKMGVGGKQVVSKRAEWRNFALTSVRFVFVKLNFVRSHNNIAIIN